MKEESDPYLEFVKTEEHWKCDKCGCDQFWIGFTWQKVRYEIEITCTGCQRATEFGS